MALSNNVHSCVSQQNFPGGVIPGTISTPTLAASPFIPYPPHPQLAPPVPHPSAVHTKEERTEEEQGARKVSGWGGEEVGGGVK